MTINYFEVEPYIGTTNTTDITTRGTSIDLQNKWVLFSLICAVAFVALLCGIIIYVICNRKKKNKRKKGNNAYKLMRNRNVAESRKDEIPILKNSLKKSISSGTSYNIPSENCSLYSKNEFTTVDNISSNV